MTSAMDHPNRVGVTAPSSDSSTRLATTAFVQNAISAAIAADFNNWQSYTPSIASASGAFGSVTAIAGLFLKVGQFVKFSASFFSSNVGTATGPSEVSLPVPYDLLVQSPTIYGRDVNATGKGLTGFGLSSGAVAVVFDDASSPSSISGIYLFIEGSYKST